MRDVLELVLLRSPADHVVGASRGIPGSGRWIVPVHAAQSRLAFPHAVAGVWTAVVDDDPRSPLGTAAALTVSGPGPALVLWWSESAAGITVVRRGRERTVHAWGADADVAHALELDEEAVADLHADGATLAEVLEGDAAVVAELLAAPDLAPAVRAVLRRPPAGRANLQELLEVLGVPSTVLDLPLQLGASEVAGQPDAVHVEAADLCTALRRSLTFVGPQEPAWLRWYDTQRRTKPRWWRTVAVLSGLAQIALAVRFAFRWDDGGTWPWLLLAAGLVLSGVGNAVAGCTRARPAGTMAAVTATGRKDA